MHFLIKITKKLRNIIVNDFLDRTFKTIQLIFVLAISSMSRLNSLLQNDAIVFFVKIGTCQFDTCVHFRRAMHLMQICVNAY